LVVRIVGAPPSAPDRREPGFYPARPWRRRRAVWAAISDLGPTTVREVAEHTGIPWQTVVSHVHRLKEAGYVEHNGPGRLRAVIPFVEAKAVRRGA
jgi:DNA-binding transcriptional ArsR family regulator